MSEAEEGQILEEKQGYVHEGRCKVCSSVDQEGESLRDMADALVIRGRTYKEVAEYLTTESGEEFNKRNIYNHIKKHSPYVYEAQEASSKASKVLKIHAQQKKADADDVLDKIVTIGDQMIDNWLENKKDSKKMEVTDKMFMEAIKEKGRRGTVTTMDMVMLQMDEELIQGVRKLPKEEKDDGDSGTTDKQSTRSISEQLDPS